MHAGGEIRIREVRAELQKAGEMELASLDGAKERGKSLDEPRNGNAPIRGILRHPKRVDTIGVKARAGAGAMEPARFDFRQVCEQGRENAAGALIVDT